MAYSSDNTARRGFVPPQNQDETLIMRHAEDLCRAAKRDGRARFSGFLSDRQQSLCEAALSRLKCDFRFDGGLPNAERRMLCICPDEETPAPIAFLKIECGGLCEQTLTHQDYLGALLGLSVERECIGDVLLSCDKPQTAWVAVQQQMSGYLSRELCEVGRNAVRVSLCNACDVDTGRLPQPEMKTATVSSLRLDSVLAAMLNTSRSVACDLIRAGRVEINHVAQSNAHAPVYAEDVFSIRGKGKFKLSQIGGKSRKDRFFVEFFKY